MAEIHTIVTGDEPAVAGDRNTIGGWPLLAADEPWPACFCGKPMVFFFQLDVPQFDGDHLLVFQCPVHDDAAFGPSQLPARYWDEAVDPYEGPFWRLLFRSSGTAARAPDPYVEPHRLALQPAKEKVDEHGRGRPGFKLGGVPSWAQSPEHYRCACGTDMVFLGQVPENFGFDMWPMRDKQGDQMQLFLGNELYILACPARCHPEAAWPVLQN
ncbi:hypothetical protein Aab01nite_49340 [Paractinoplanes abujensis]|uniref:DUF1963 domain-containing protein n=1 Tax=Paractinoplanes abujensis TaxID=882441 RepID=A0A7W7G1B2_9ACTN|nr:hypothetical protein [Actinoplanes abujensis]MBB4693998.1 hypothetical protein [Actinoplanes abujensis]GID21344.1 hypothetical protein Aab01nite_49340 [Actinoplanes abujensis]